MRLCMGWRDWHFLTCSSCISKALFEHASSFTFGSDDEDLNDAERVVIAAYVLHTTDNWNPLTLPTHLKR